MPNFFIIEPVDNRARRLPFTGAGWWRPYYVAAGWVSVHDRRRADTTDGGWCSCISSATTRRSRLPRDRPGVPRGSPTVPVMRAST